jgi:hypothetical protein
MDLNNPVATVHSGEIEIQVYIVINHVHREPNPPSHVEPFITEPSRTEAPRYMPPRMMPTPKTLPTPNTMLTSMNMPRAIYPCVVTPAEPLASLPPPTPAFPPPKTPAFPPPGAISRVGTPSRVGQARVSFVPDPRSLSESRTALADTPSGPSNHAADADGGAVPRSPEKRARAGDLWKL